MTSLTAEIPTKFCWTTKSIEYSSSVARRGRSLLSTIALSVIAGCHVSSVDSSIVDGHVQRGWRHCRRASASDVEDHPRRIQSHDNPNGATNRSLTVARDIYYRYAARAHKISTDLCAYPSIRTRKTAAPLSGRVGSLYTCSNRA